MKKLCKRALALLFVLSLVLTLPLSALAEAPGESPAEESAPPSQEPSPAQGEEGSEAQEEAPSQREIYVSAQGSDESGTGTEQAPYQSLARAARDANETPDATVYVFLMTDLEMKESARFAGREVILLPADKSVTLKRVEGFLPVKDAGGRAYNPAMIELRAPEGTGKTAGHMLLMGLILDDAGLHEGSVFEALSPNLIPNDADAAPAAAPDTPAEPAGEAKNSGEERPSQVQDAIVSVGDSGSLTLGRGTELRNFGGLSAVHLGENSQLTMEPESAIRDTKEADNQRPALLLPESARVELMEGARLVERGVKPEDKPLDLGDIFPDVDELSFSSLEFTGPESLTQDDAVTDRYEIPYELSFTVSDTVKTLVESQKDNLQEASGLIIVTLDSRLTGDSLSTAVLNSGVFALDGDVSYDASTHSIQARFKLKEDWQEHLDSLGEAMSFSCKGFLPAENFEPSTETEDKYLSSKGKAEITLRFTLGEEEKTFTLSGSEKTAKTKLLGKELYLLKYDVNGGNAGSGPADEQVPAQKSYKLKTEPVPTHKKVDGVSVIFLGWCLAKDTTIYEREKDAPNQGTPNLVKTVDISAQSSPLTVYAVYGKDLNGDGIGDVFQNLVKLSFNGNAADATNVPGPIYHVVGSITDGELGVNIPAQEPDRLYYTFLGWNENPNATENDKLYKHDAEQASMRDLPMKTDKTLYAVWKENYRIIYDANGGENAPAPSILPYMTKVTDSSGKSYYTGRTKITEGVPTREGYEFKGWATSRRGAAAYFAGDEVQISKGNVTLYAAWVRSTGGGGTVAPKTGDTDMGLYAALLGGSVLLLAGAGLFLWKKRHSD